MRAVRYILAVLGLVISGTLYFALSYLSIQAIERREVLDVKFERTSALHLPEQVEDGGTVYVDETDEMLLRRIDFTSLQAINPDTAAWVTIPDTNVDYYVMQEPEGMPEGEYEYLWKDIEKKESKWGSIFMPYVPEKGAVQLLFGHRMKDRTVAFSNMKLFLEQAYLDEHPYVYLYYPDRAERWRVWAACNADYMDVVYRIQPAYELGSPEYGALLLHIGNDLSKAGSGTASRDQPLLVLSTCYQDDVRMFIACVPDRAYYYQKD